VVWLEVVVVGGAFAAFLVGSAAPIAAFMATKAAGGLDLHPEQSEGPKRSAGWRMPAILLRDAKAAPLWAAGGK
jgi:hypothetical protein